MKCLHQERKEDELESDPGLRYHNLGEGGARADVCWVRFSDCLHTEAG